MNVAMIVIHVFCLVFFFPLLIFTVPMHMLICMSSGYREKQKERKEIRKERRFKDDQNFDGRLKIVTALVGIAVFAYFGGALVAQ